MWNEAGKRLIEFCQENALVIANTHFQQHKRRLYMDITRWSTPKSDWLYSLQPWWRSSIQSAKTRPGTDCGSDHELLIAKFRLKLKKVVKTTRPFRYDLNQISYDYTVEMTTHSSTLAWEIPWTEEPGRLQSLGLQRGGHDWATELNWMA